MIIKQKYENTKNDLSLTGFDSNESSLEDVFVVCLLYLNFRERVSVLLWACTFTLVSVYLYFSDRVSVLLWAYVFSVIVCVNVCVVCFVGLGLGASFFFQNRYSHWNNAFFLTICLCAQQPNTWLLTDLSVCPQVCVS